MYRLVGALEKGTDHPGQPERILKRDQFSIMMTHGDLEQ